MGVQTRVAFKTNLGCGRGFLCVCVWQSRKSDEASGEYKRITPKENLLKVEMGLEGRDSFQEIIRSFEGKLLERKKEPFHPPSFGYFIFSLPCSRYDFLSHPVFLLWLETCILQRDFRHKENVLMPDQDH